MTEQPTRFREVFLESGEDDDHTYVSFSLKRQPDGNVLIEIIMWLDLNVGVNMYPELTEVNLNLRFMGECGTVSRHWLSKKTFTYLLTREEEERVEQIDTNIGPITISIRKPVVIPLVK